MRNQFLSLLLVLTGFIPLLPAQNFDPFAAGGTGPIKTESELFSTSGSIAPGQSFQVVLKLIHPEGWHSYYHNPGLGIPSLVPSVDWDLPAGFVAGEIQWPIPHQADFVGLKSQGYSGTNYFVTTLTAPPNLAMGESVKIAGKASWQMCLESCINEKASFTLSLPVAEAPEPDQARSKELADYAKSHLPVEMPDSWQLAATDDGNTITLTITNAGPLVEGLFFYDYDGQVDAQTAQTFTSPTEGVWELKVPRNLGTTLSDTPGPVMETLKGILSAGEEIPGTGAHGVNLSVAFGVPSMAGPSSPALGILAGIFGGMFLGGLILNLMPCVFPVIGLKIMNFVQQAGEDRKKITIHGVVFVVGVLVSFWILAGLLLAGGIKNWGAQLENPWVVLSLLLIMLALGMAMFGVFELGSSATGVGSKLMRKDGLTGTFFSGVLATVIATPCAGPFLGSAIGATLGLPPALFILAFTMMGLGLGAPYLVLSIFPGLIEKLPRPGAWMESFKQGMSFLLFASAGYLLWVYSSQVFLQLDGRKGFYVMLGISLFAMGLWVFGRWTTPVRKKGTRWLARGMSLAFLMGGVLLAMPSTKKNEWEKWSLEKQERLIAEGKPVFVDFTAAWCVTCQTNKAGAYSAETWKLIKQHKVVLLKADKTTTVPEIDAELNRLGKSAIPVNVLYVHGSKEPHITETVLTPGNLQKFFRDILGDPDPD